MSERRQLVNFRFEQFVQSERIVRVGAGVLGEVGIFAEQRQLIEVVEVNGFLVEQVSVRAV